MLEKWEQPLRSMQPRHDVPFKVQGGIMIDPKVRTLCAQITLEADQDKCEVLVMQLASLLGVMARGERERGATKGVPARFVPNYSSKALLNEAPDV